MTKHHKLSLEIPKRESISLDGREERRREKFKRKHKHGRKEGAP